MKHTNDTWSDEIFDNHEDHIVIEDFDNTHDEIKDVNEDEIDESLSRHGLDEDEIIDTGSIEDFNKERISEVTGKTVTNYVDNDTFCNAIVAWNKSCKEAQEQGKKIPIMTDIIGIQIEKMAEGLSHRYNFRNYTYIDEMKSDAIYMACRAIKNFDPEKSTNAFGYFTFVMWRAMTSRIKAEKKEHETKMSLLKDPMYIGYTNETSDVNINKDKLISIYDQN